MLVLLGPQNHIYQPKSLFKGKTNMFTQMKNNENETVD